VVVLLAAPILIQARLRLRRRPGHAARAAHGFLACHSPARTWGRRDASRDRLARREALGDRLSGSSGITSRASSISGPQYVSRGLGRLILFLYPTLVVVLSIIFCTSARHREIVALESPTRGCAGDVTLPGRATAPTAGAALCSRARQATRLPRGRSQVVQRVGSIRSPLRHDGREHFLHRAVLLLRPLRRSRCRCPYTACAAMALFRPCSAVFRHLGGAARPTAHQVALIGALGPVTTIFFSAMDWTRP